MKTKYAVIYNPNAGKKQKDRLDTVQRVLTAAGADFIVLETDLNNRPRARTEEAIRAGRTGIIGCGGDGTINEIGSVVYRHPDTVLGIVPTGSGNDIARSQGLPLDAEKAVKRILKNEIKETDCGFANDHFFLNIASIGFDAEVVHKKTTLPRWVPPNLGYRLSVLLLMLAYREDRMRIRFNEHEMDRPMLLAPWASAAITAAASKSCRTPLSTTAPSKSAPSKTLRSPSASSCCPHWVPANT